MMAPARFYSIVSVRSIVFFFLFVPTPLYGEYQTELACKRAGLANGTESENDRSAKITFYFFCNSNFKSLLCTLVGAL